MLEINQRPDGVSFTVKVLPKSSRNEILGESEGMLRVKLTAPPVDGKANKLLIKFLSDRLKTARSNITIVSGELSRTKLLHIAGVSAAEVASLAGK